MKKLILSIICLLLAAAPALAQISLSGLWIDRRTGNDFWEIDGSEEAFRFTAYGGNPAQPRYLSRGVALALEEGQLRATIRDLPGYCCGQQGSLRIKLLSPNQLQVNGQYGNAPEVSFILSRGGTAAAVSALPLPSVRYEQPPAPLAGQVSPGWDGVWQGDGWASFFIRQEGGTLYMYWYYSQESPFFGRYEITDGQAQGMAVALAGKPGNSFYRQNLRLSREPLRISVISQRLAAPLEDGRWVSFRNAPPLNFELHKLSDELPAVEDRSLREWFSQHHPQTMLDSTLKQARQAGGLLEREK